MKGGSYAMFGNSLKRTSEELELKDYIKLNSFRNRLHSHTKNSLKRNQDERSSIGKTELNAILFKLKKYYNELNNLSTEKQKEIIVLKDKCENIDKKVFEMKSLDDIELKFEKISVKETSMFKETKEEIQQKIEKLMAEKNDKEVKYKNEIEYRTTLAHLITSEKEKLQTYNDILTWNSEKLAAIKNFNFNLETNNCQNKKKSENLKNVLGSLNKEQSNLSQIMNYGKNELNKQIEQLAIKERAVQELKIEIEKKNELMEGDLKLEKERILKELRETEEVKKFKLEKETDYIKLILGLDLIKKYFIDVEREGRELNYSELLNSNEYKIFTSKNFFLSDESDKKDQSNIKLNNVLSKTDKDFYKRKNSLPRKATNRLQCSPPKRTMDHFHSIRTNSLKPLNTLSSKIFLIDIKEKYKNLDVDYEILMSICSKMVYKTSFYHTNMINLNMKIINLEGKKDKYTVQVKEIMSHNYKNFNDLVKNNSRFENFMLGYKQEIRIQNENQLGLKFKNDLGNILLDDSNFFDYKSQYEKYINFMSMIKRFLEIINTLFKLIHKENGVIKEEKHLKTFLKLTHKMKADMRVIRSKLDEVLKIFDKFFVSGIEGNEATASVVPQIGDTTYLFNKNYIKPLFKRSSTSTGILTVMANRLEGGKKSSTNEQEASSNLLDNKNILPNSQKGHRKSTYGHLQNALENNNLLHPVQEDFSNTNSKGEYLEDIFSFYEKEDLYVIELKEKVENLSNISLDDVRDFIFSSPTAKNNFFDLNIQLEKALYHFFYNFDNIKNLFILISQTEKFLKENLHSANDSKQQSKELDSINIDDEEFFEKMILPLNGNSINKTAEPNEENLYEAELEKEKEFEENFYTKHKEDQTIASLQGRRVSSVKPMQITARDKDPLARTHIGFGQDINQKIINKLYKPFISQKDYNKNLNKNIPQIKRDTRNSAILNHYLKKKEKDIYDIAKDFVIYDNPSINIENISNTTYNSYVKNLFSNKRDRQDSHKKSEREKMPSSKASSQINPTYHTISVSTINN